MARVREELEEATFWRKDRNGIRDSITPREEFISKDKFDFSGTRQNIDNKLFAKNFGRVVSLEVDRIEKSNLFHFYPNSNSLFVGLPGCNVKSPFCSEIEIRNKALHDSPLDVKYQYFTPEQLVEHAEKKNAKSITFNETEPFVWLEYAFKVARNAHRGNIKTTLVTNGFTTEEPIKKIGKFLDAVTIKVYGSINPELYDKYLNIKDVYNIFAAIKQFKKQKLAIEITNLIVPQIGDSLEQCSKLAAWISHELEADTPFHLLQFHPNGTQEFPPTPVSTLERLAEECRRGGLRYVYIHSAPSHTDENTYCHNCRELVVERRNNTVRKSLLKDGRCPRCGVRLNFVS